MSLFDLFMPGLRRAKFSTKSVAFAIFMGFFCDPTLSSALDLSTWNIQPPDIHSPASRLWEPIPPPFPVPSWWNATLLAPIPQVSTPDNPDTETFVSGTTVAPIPSVKKPLARDLQGDDAEYKKTEYQYYAALMNHNIEAYKHQETSSRAMLGLVILCTLTGLGLSVYQIRAGNLAASAQNTNIEISPILKISSSAIGILILTLSFAFMIVYCTSVHELKPLDLPVTSTQKSN